MRARRVAAALGTGALIALCASGPVRSADESTGGASPTLRKYCAGCHGGAKPAAALSLEKLAASHTVGDAFFQWERVAGVLEQKKMPPPGLPQPSDAERQQAVTWIRASLRDYAVKHDGEPGRVMVRRLTSAEYGYTVHDLTGLDLDLGIDPATDSVGGEGFTNFGDVQFIHDASLERYLEAAKIVADHAVVGTGPISFFHDPGKTGFELSAITRIQDIYKQYGFRTVSGEGGIPFGLDKYGRAFYVAWRYQHRAALGEANATLAQIAKREGIETRFAQHIWDVVNRPALAFPSVEAVARWKKLPAPGADDAKVRAGCTDIQKFVTTWPSWLFSRGDVAAGGAGDESPLVLTADALKTETKHRFVFRVGSRPGRAPTPLKSPVKLWLNVDPVSQNSTTKPVLVWRKPTVITATANSLPKPVTAGPGATAEQQAAAAAATLRRGLPGTPKPLRAVVSEATAQQLKFGASLDGSAMGEDDFAAAGSIAFEVPVPEGTVALQFSVEAELGTNRDTVVKVLFSDRPDGGSRGIPTRALMGDMQSAGYKQFVAGVLELAALLPPNSHSEATPADKDPPPPPFDPTFNTPEHDAYDTRVRYERDDEFLTRYMLDDATRTRLEQAWHDLHASFEYYDNYVDLLAQHFNLKLASPTIAAMTPAEIEKLPAETRQYFRPLRAEYEAMQKALAAAQPGHVEDCLRFASAAWRRPLTAPEKDSLRRFYTEAREKMKLDHTAAIRATLARILVAPAFLYRTEPGVALSAWDLASRLSFFLWSSVPDDELRRAAAAGELNENARLAVQVRRMLRDPKARRMATEFFGQWLGFYRFDQHRGVDTSRFPEFTDEVKSAMYDEAISFFEHIIRQDRPLADMLYGNYTFLNQPLAKFYGVKQPVKSKDVLELVENADAFHRGGALRLGAVLTVTSAPLRTSPVKRGDWVLRRVLGTPTPPPPADAGSIPADDKSFGDMTVKQRLAVHKRNATCASCHMRIDPLGFPLEHFDATGRWRDTYQDGKAVEDAAELADKTAITGADGLLNYLRSQDAQINRTAARKLIGYALGRTVQGSDQLLVERLSAAGPNAKFSELIVQLVTSKQFRTRQGDDAKAVAAIRRTESKGPGVR